MKKYIYLIVLSFLTLGNTIIIAQTSDPNISFDEHEFDFEKIKEAEGRVSHTFEFNNTGAQPLVISNVKTSCGCTTPAWSKAPIPPGGNGFIKVTYNPMSRPGTFSKSITITSNAIENRVVLKIKGNVIPKPKTLNDQYPYKLGNCLISSKTIKLNTVFKSIRKGGGLTIYNPTDKPISISFSDIPEHIKIKSIPVVLQPKKIGLVSLVYDAKKKNDWGRVTDKLNIVLDKKTEKNYIKIEATILEDFSHLSAEELAKAPKIIFESKTFNFASIKQGDVISHNFTFKNDGSSDLDIRKLTANCDCIKIVKYDKIVKSGKNSTIKVTFNPEKLKGKVRKNITLLSNAPNSQKIVLWLRGNVE